MAIKAESNNEAFIDPADATSLINITAEVDGVSMGSSGGLYNVDANTQMQVVDIVSVDGFKGDGVLKLKISNEKHNISETIKLKVDFSKVDTNTFTKEGTFVSGDGKVAKVEIEADKMGTNLRVDDYNLAPNEEIILKVDERIYRNYDAMTASEDSIFMSFSKVSKEEIENAKNISILKAVSSDKDYMEVTSELVNGEYVEKSNMTDSEIEESNKVYEEEFAKEENLRKTLPKENKEDVEYIKEIVSQDGNKVFITNIEREDKKLKVYIDGDNKNDVLRVAFSMDIIDSDDQYSFNNSVIENSKGYIVEFNDVDEGKLKLHYEDMLISKEGRVLGEAKEIEFK